MCEGSFGLQSETDIGCDTSINEQRGSMKLHTYGSHRVYPCPSVKDLGRDID